MKRQRARPSRSPGWLAAALKASWPPLSTSTFSTHSVMTSGERSLPMPCGLRSPHLAGGGTAGDARHEFGGARDHGAAVAGLGGRLGERRVGEEGRFWGGAVYFKKKKIILLDNDR